MINSAYFIPTNKPCEKSLRSYIKEIAFAKKTYGIEVPFVLVESARSNSEKLNARVLHELKKEYPSAHIYHITRDILERYFDTLLKNGLHEFYNCFVPDKKDYGAAFNRIFILAVAMRKDAFHRRDADTSLLFDEFPSLDRRFPIEIEIEYLGKKMCDIAQSSLARQSGQVQVEREILVVGSNYFGEWNLDVKYFAKKSMSIVHNLYKILGFPEDSIVSLCADSFNFNKSPETKDLLHLITSVADAYNPDCGNIAVKTLHEWLPALSARNMLACDYFTFDTASSLGIPAIHHTRDVFHEYTPDRFILENKISYWEAVMKFADYFNAYMSIYNSDWDQKCGRNRTSVVDNKIIRNISQNIAKFAGLNIDGRKTRIAKICKEVLIPFDERYAMVGQHLLRQADCIINETVREYTEHARLLVAWTDIVEHARKMPLYDFASEVR